MKVGKVEEYPHIGGESFNILIMVRSWELERAKRFFFVMWHVDLDV